ncbi:MAG: hypothetical protein J6I49_07475 [Bacteroidales bacterium]|nr:hypothetical protein [Bacteroidales bacterium]
MAKLSQGILGPFSGKVGTVVGYRWKGLECVRGYRREIRYPNTAMQQTEREWFVSMVRFAARARQALLLGLAAQAAERQMTEGNLFVNRNKHCFRNVDGMLQTDYAALTFAVGSAAPVAFRAPQVSADGGLKVDFEKNTQFSRASPEDRVYLYAYCPEAEGGLLSAPTARRTKQLRMALPDAWRGREVHLWGFVVDREGRPSPSSYIGSTLQTSPEHPASLDEERTPMAVSGLRESDSLAEGHLEAPRPDLRP